jgi:hypothetical protein
LPGTNTYFKHPNLIVSYQKKLRQINK